MVFLNLQIIVWLDGEAYAASIYSTATSGIGYNIDMLSGTTKRRMRGLLNFVMVVNKNIGFVEQNQYNKMGPLEEFIMRQSFYSIA